MGILGKFKSKKQEKKEISEKEASLKVEKKDKEITSKKDEKSSNKVDKSLKKQKKNVFANHDILVKPLISEKSAMAESEGKYTFKVSLSSDKLSIKKAINDIYGVKPSKVRIINYEGKSMNFGRKTGRRSDWKKAIVTMPKGKTINIHEGV